MILIFLSSVVIILFSFWHYSRRNLYKHAAKIPGPLTLPFIGNAYLYLLLDLPDLRQVADKVIDKYGSIFKLCFFHILLIVVSDPNKLQVILNHPNSLDKEERYRLAKDVFGSGLMTSPGHIWKHQRKMITPAFSKKIVTSFVNCFIEHGDILVKQLEKEDGKIQSFDANKYISRCTLDFICETAMGVSINAQNNGSNLLELTTRAAELLVTRVTYVWLHSDVIFRMSSIGREFYKLVTSIHNFTEPFIKRRREEILEKHKGDLVFNENIRKPFMEHFLTLDVNLTPLEIRQEVELFIVAGSDTVSTTCQYVLVALGMHQDIQAKVREELNDIFGETNRQMVIEDLPKLQYLERAINETMRIYAPAPFIARSVIQDIKLDDYTIPKGSSILIPIFKVHRSPNLWEDPLKFNPDRFLPENITKRHPYSYLPFSRGVRDCIGKAYAYDACKVLLATVLRNYQIFTPLTPETIKFKTEVTSKIMGGAQITIKKL